MTPSEEQWVDIAAGQSRWDPSVHVSQQKSAMAAAANAQEGIRTRGSGPAELVAWPSLRVRSRSRGRPGRSNSSPPSLGGAAFVDELVRATTTDGSATVNEGRPWAGPTLKQHLLAVLRLRLSEGGGTSRGSEAGLKFKK